MGAGRKHIVFVDDSGEELETFEKLYSGDKFQVTTVQVQRPSQSLKQVAEKLAGKSPDLFVLDLFFPEADVIPTGLSTGAAQKTHARIAGIVHLLSGLERHFHDGNRLLKEAHGAVVESQRLLLGLCEELGQSPRGGIRVLKELNREYPDVPKVFYSRKATINDLKEAMMESGLDVLSKPQPSMEDREAPRLKEEFARQCAGQPSAWVAKWMEHLPRWASDFMAKFLAELTTRQRGSG